MPWDLLIGLAVAGLASFIASRMMIAVGITDAPDLARKMHGAPTPTSGGVALALGFALGLAALTLTPAPHWSAALSPEAALRMAAGAGAALIFAGIGLIDDMHHLRAWPKLAVFALGALIAPLLIGGPDAIVLGDGAVLPLPFWLAILGAALWMFVLTNAVNFLDGANGLATGAVAIGLAALALVSVSADAPHPAALALCGVGAIIGFLYWNFPNGRLFVGDAGALFIGALAATASLLAIEDGGLSLFTPPTLFLPILADALLTLAWRLGRRPQLLDGHRDHLYQIALRAGRTHEQVTPLFWLATLTCCVAGVLASELAQGRWLPFAWRTDVVEAALSYLPFAVFAILAGMALIISARIRRFAAANGLDGP